MGLFPLSRLLGAEIRRRSAGLSRIMGAMRSLENSLASMVVGWTKRMLPGFWSMM